MTPRKLIYSLGHLVGILGAAWCFYCREWAQGIALLTGVGCLRFDPPEGSAPRLSSTLPIMCLASLAFGACAPSAGVDFCAGVHIKRAEPLVERAFDAISPQAQGLNGDYVRMTEQAALPSQCAGFGCVYTKSSDHLLRFADTSGNERIMGEASRLRSSAGTPADVALTWLWYDSGTDKVMARLAVGNVTLVGAGGNVTLDTTQTISGAKTFSTAPTMPAATYVYGRVNGGGTGALGAATKYLTAAGAASATEYPLSQATRVTTARSLYCYLGTAPGGSDTVVFTVRKSGSDQTLTCTITGAATTCNDTTHSFTTAAGNRLSIKAVSSAGTAADATCSFEEGN